MYLKGEKLFLKNKKTATLIYVKEKRIQNQSECESDLARQSFRS